ncbi:hypothetical protein AZE42_01466 [Rhizopogon vesiculosus]|uniref:Terpene synthase n=1 Tax=Rhizopogon vesiculosus TaxID=180088 RepID=A0A1J8PMJ4_9AGAM|nr:hypothetical protein AZE42_01466 [Rhizopogon vesiculosus]
MDGKYSIRSFMAVGVALTANTYAHIPDRATRMWVCLLSTLTFSVDDDLDGGQDMDDMNRFNERFVNCQPQGNPALEALGKVLREAPRYYSSFVSNLVTTSVLDYMSSITLDHKTKNMQISTRTPSYPEYWRIMSGLTSVTVLFIFPSTLPVEDCIQSMPDLAIIAGYVNDVLSFYKKEIAGDTANYVSLRAASRAITKLDALHEVIDQTVHVHHNILESLKPHTEAYEAYVSFFHGYIRFHASPRYKLEELLSEVILQQCLMGGISLYFSSLLC